MLAAFIVVSRPAHEQEVWLAQVLYQRHLELTRLVVAIQFPKMP